MATPTNTSQQPPRMQPKSLFSETLTTAVVVMLTLCFFASVAQAQADYEPVFEWAECPFPLPAGEIEADTIDCGYLIVPENRHDLDTEFVELAVAILYSTGIDPEPDPLIYLAGGPGDSALLDVESWTNSSFRANRDIILFDQRGTGFSYPNLACPEADEDPENGEQACYDRLLREGVDLAAYNSAASTADITDLITVLELEALNIYGVSYGTRLALTIMRDQPADIRSVMLDSAYPPHVAGLDDQPGNAASAIQHLFATCAQAAACTSAYGDLEQTFYTLVDDWNAEPALAYDYELEEEIEVFGDDLVDKLFQALYSTNAIPVLPYAIALLADGEIDYGLELLSGAYTAADVALLDAGEELPEVAVIDFDPDEYDIPAEDSSGMYNSVECYEEVHFNSPAAAAASVAGTAPQLAEQLITSVDEQFVSCAIWNIERAPALENEPVVSDIPTLILAGSFDPITPPAWGRAAAEYLGNSTFIEFPHGGHGLIDGGDCPVNIMLEFIDNPVATPNTGCVADIRLEFYVP